MIIYIQYSKNYKLHQQRWAI